jgi:transposase
VTTCPDPLPADLAAAHALILAQREQLILAKSEVTVGRLEIERLKLMLAKARREQFGQSSERGKLLVERKRSVEPLVSCWSRRCEESSGSDGGLG